MLEMLRARPGFIPARIDVEGRKLIWEDMESYHCYEGFFHHSLQMLSALRQLRNPGKETMGAPTSFASDLDALQDAHASIDPLYPSGFIFHVGRSGSTLLAKALARSRSNLVLGEPAPINQLWAVLSNGWREPVGSDPMHAALFKNLVLAMGRRRVPTHRAYFVKFTSYNLHFFDFIRAVFPDVPALFLYRGPEAVLASMKKNPPGWMQSRERGFASMLTGVAQFGFLDGEAFAMRSLERFYSLALQADHLQYLSYESLRAESLPAILRYFNLDPCQEEMTSMKSQFRFYSKNDYRAREFKTGPAADNPSHARAELSPLWRLHNDLSRSSRNLAL